MMAQPGSTGPPDQPPHCVRADRGAGSMNRILLIVMPLLLAVGLLAVAWDDISPAAPRAEEGHAAAATDYERGPHRGRLRVMSWCSR